MSWAHGVLPDGREVGYGVPTICGEPGCDTAIDRGLSYLCGRMHGDEQYGCGGYFCEEHLFFGSPTGNQQCDRCYGQPGSDLDGSPVDGSGQ